METEYTRLVNTAFDALKAAEGNPEALGEPFRTVVLVCTAKGIIDNGGIRYFFEADFPFKPDYHVFTKAFRNIGMAEAARDFDAAIAMFPFDAPHMDAQRRNEFMESFETDPAGKFQSAGDRIMDESESAFESRVVKYANAQGISPA